MQPIPNETPDGSKFRSYYGDLTPKDLPMTEKMDHFLFDVYVQKQVDTAIANHLLDIDSKFRGIENRMKAEMKTLKKKVLSLENSTEHLIKLCSDPDEHDSKNKRKRENYKKKPSQDEFLDQG